LHIVCLICIILVVDQADVVTGLELPIQQALPTPARSLYHFCH
jgi:hypothetical protein